MRTEGGKIYKMRFLELDLCHPTLHDGTVFAAIVFAECDISPFCGIVFADYNKPHFHLILITEPPQ
jgi:hypothetical protein